MTEDRAKKSSQHPEKKRFSPVSVALIVAAVIFSVLVVRLIQLVTGKPSMSVDYLAEYNKVTQPTDYDPNENAAPYYEEAFAAFVRMPNGMHEFLYAWPGDINEAELDAIQKWLTSNSKALGYLRAATQKPYYWVEHNPKNNRLDMIDTWNLIGLRKTAELLEVQSKLMACRGQMESALNCVIDLHEMGAHLTTGPKSLLEQLAGKRISLMAFRVVSTILTRAEIGPTILAKFQHRLEEQIEQVPKQFLPDGQRIVDYYTIDQCFADDGKGDGDLIPGRFIDFFLPTRSSARVKYYPAALWISLTNPGKAETIELTKKLYEFHDEASKQTPWQLRQKGISYEDKVEELRRNNYFVSFLAGDYMSSRNRRLQEYNAQGHALIATVAILRYKAVKGHLPENLESLVTTGYLSKLPMDPYSGKSLVYKRLGNDFTLYSVWVDFVDNGGTSSAKQGKGEGTDYIFWPVSTEHCTSCGSKTHTAH